MGLRVAGVRKGGVARMSKKFTRRARLVREILRLAIVALRLVAVVLEILNKAVNCHDRKLQVQI